MDCKTAQHVWNHRGGLIAGLNCRMPGLMDHLAGLVKAFKENVPNGFDAAVKRRSGDGPYRVTHEDGLSELSRWTHDVIGDAAACRALERELGARFGIPDLRLANVCCGGCKVSDGDLGDELDLAIQLAAVNTNPDGSPIA
jgi:hypothetical protein